MSCLFFHSAASFSGQHPGSGNRREIAENRLKAEKVMDFALYNTVQDKEHPQPEVGLCSVKGLVAF